ncbi:hypothetical protein LIA77_07189 [Sarocladium implicatum]|nr:hypothetical protein LIA77_07189 [Sarocladium implicatum]
MVRLGRFGLECAVTGMASNTSDDKQPPDRRSVCESDRLWVQIDDNTLQERLQVSTSNHTGIRQRTIGSCRYTLPHPTYSYPCIGGIHVFVTTLMSVSEFWPSELSLQARSGDTTLGGPHGYESKAPTEVIR